MSSWKNSLSGYAPVQDGPVNTSLHDQRHSEETLLEKHTASPTRHYSFVSIFITASLSLLIGIGIGSAITALNLKTTSLPGTAPRIPLPTISRSFNFSTPFTDPPPSGLNTSEPIWDSLIPRGLGYFHDTSVSPVTSIPTVFHSLHCLYLVRRAYYAESDAPARFDLGKDRETHVAHCFDYLQQALTCSADSTAEPAVDHENGFLGSGFQRECRDFEALKEWVEERRVFDATGFLADGLMGHAVGE